MSKKVDFFRANKDMSAQVVEFMDSKVWSITITKRAQLERKAIQSRIDALTDVKGKSAQAVKAQLTKQLADVGKKVAQERAKNVNFKYSKADTELFKAYSA